VGKAGELTLLPAYVPIVGSFVAIAIAKHAFGGLGHNIWNPALVGRAFVHVAFASQMNPPRWPWPRGLDAVTQATALAKEGDFTYEYLSLFAGNVPGCIGEVSAVLLIIGGAYLIYEGYVDWRVPATYVGAVFLLAWILPTRMPGAHPNAPLYGLFTGAASSVWPAGGAGLPNDPLYHVLSGGLMLGAFFMATDMVTSPLTRWGQFVFALGCGVLTALIRFYTGFPEGVCYSILIMNTVRPLIDRWTQPAVFGARTR